LSKNEKMRIVVGTGWYSSATIREYKTHGDERIRGPEVRPYWWKSINDYISPDVVVVVDSASPIKPSDQDYSNVKLVTIELDDNPGHATEARYHYSGWTASVVLGLEYAFVSGADAFVYVEQDVLLRIPEFHKYLEDLLMVSPYIFGSGDSTPQILQQSFFCIGRRGMRRFLSRLHDIDMEDRSLAPEQKFHIAVAGRFSYILLRFFRERIVTIPRIGKRMAPLYPRILELTKNYETWPFGYGRARPIDFSNENFYFQHGTTEELNAYLDLKKKS